MDSQQIYENHLNIWQQKLANGLSLVGPLLNSQKHKDFYYLFYDGTKQFAGLYENDLKEGVWFELKLSKPIEDYELDKYIDQIDCDELNIHLILLQNHLKQGEWVEEWEYNQNQIYNRKVDQVRLIKNLF